jgi:hypothetical protein
LALVFYGATTAAAIIWGVLAGRPLLWTAGTSWARASLGALVGLGLGLGVVGLSRLAVRRLVWARELNVWFGSLLGPLSTGDCLALAALSAVGEELLFRGAMQPTLGLILTTVLFGLAHVPPRVRYLPWTIAAAVLGLAFGVLAQHGGSLAGPIVAHFVVNALNLVQVARTVAARDRPDQEPAPQENLPGSRLLPSIDLHETPHDPCPPRGEPGSPRGDGDSNR